MVIDGGYIALYSQVQERYKLDMTAILTQRSNALLL